LRILVVEDHAVVREGLMLALHALAQPDTACAILGAESADAATRMFDSGEEFDLILLDLMLPGTGGLAFLGVLRRRFPEVPVAVLSAHDDADTVLRAMRQGAAGFVSKSSPTGVLLEALRTILAGENWLPPQYRELVGKKRKRAKTVAQRYGLTNAQTAVLELLVEGKANQEIAAQLGSSVGTVKIHVSAIFKAMGVTNRSQALVVAQGKSLLV
jgi:DNA-binding NarL/FixJ family response regulator